MGASLDLDDIGSLDGETMVGEHLGAQLAIGGDDDQASGILVQRRDAKACPRDSAQDVKDAGPARGDAGALHAARLIEQRLVLRVAFLPDGFVQADVVMVGIDEAGQLNDSLPLTVTRPSRIIVLANRLLARPASAIIVVFLV